MHFLSLVSQAFLPLNFYVKVSVVIALSLYPPMAWQILTGKAEQNLATFILWGMLDSIAAASNYVMHGNWFLPAAYVAGCLIVVASLLIVRTWQWTSFETMCSILVLICIVGWKLSGPYLANIFASTGVGLATLPVLKDTVREPDKSPLVLYLLFTIANLFNLAGGADWSVKERLYPSVCVVLCFLVAAAACLRFVPARQRPRGLYIDGV